MKPLTLHPEELPHALSLEPGQSFLIARPMEPQPPEGFSNREQERHEDKWLFRLNESPWNHIVRKSPFGPIGSEFFVQEEWGIHSYPEIRGHCNSYIYKADKVDDCEWQSASTMPESASRLTLRHTGTEVSRAMDILASDKYSMGFGVETVWREQWQTRHGDQFPWDSNPWIWMSNFEVVE